MVKEEQKQKEHYEAELARINAELADEQRNRIARGGESASETTRETELNNAMTTETKKFQNAMAQLKTGNVEDEIECASERKGLAAAVNTAKKAEQASFLKLTQLQKKYEASDKVCKNAIKKKKQFRIGCNEATQKVWHSGGVTFRN